MGMDGSHEPNCKENFLTIPEDARDASLGPQEAWQMFMYINIGHVLEARVDAGRDRPLGSEAVSEALSAAGWARRPRCHTHGARPGPARDIVRTKTGACG